MLYEDSGAKMRAYLAVVLIAAGVICVDLMYRDAKHAETNVAANSTVNTVPKG
jgi:hypothetical protein